MSDFSFPALPKPRPLSQELRPGGAVAQQQPPTNPLLARATVTDLTAAAVPAGGAGAAAAAAPGVAPSSTGGIGQAGEQVASDMGGAMSAPPSRYGRMAPGPRQKAVPFEKGWSQMDWVRLTQTHPDLAGLGPGGRPRRGITLEEVAAHNTREDCWTVLRGKVYNITPYLRYHPGGVPLLLKVAGKDGTALFNKYHAWVNYEFLLAKCLVGLLAPPSASTATSATAGVPAGGSSAAAAAGAGAAPAAAAAATGGGAAGGQQEEGEGGSEGPAAAAAADGGSSKSSSSTNLLEPQRQAVGEEHSVLGDASSLQPATKL